MLSVYELIRKFFPNSGHFHSKCKTIKPLVTSFEQTVTFVTCVQSQTHPKNFEKKVLAFFQFHPFKFSFETSIYRCHNAMKTGVVKKSTFVNRFVLQTLQRDITHLAVITRRTNIKLGNLKGENWKRAKILSKSVFLV